MNLIRRTDHWLPSVFDDVFNSDWLGNNENTHQIGTHIPAVNVKETAAGFTVEVAAPGKKKDDFKVAINNNLLTISAQVKEENKSKNEEEKFTRREFSYQAFKRSFSLPEHINNAKIAANYSDGVLKIDLPLQEESKTKSKRFIDIT